MKQKAEEVLTRFARQHADKRLHVVDLSVNSADERSVHLGGRVLEEKGLDALHEMFAAELPGAAVDSSGVTVLRRPNPTLLAVAANLTDLHKEPSFLAEMLTQVMNGVVLEVLEEKGEWCFVRQQDGYLGWAYKPYLAPVEPPVPTHYVVAPVAAIYAPGSNPLVPLGRLPGGTAVQLEQVEHDRAYIRTAGGMLPAGWVPRQYLRSIASLPPSAEDARTQMVADARLLTGVYYLWGGGSAFGIDCSGLCQLVHRLSGYTLPRDADMQFRAGTPVEPPYRPGDLLFFHRDGNPEKITHVGLSTGGWDMIHSSRARNGVYEENVQANESLRGKFAGARTFLPR